MILLFGASVHHRRSLHHSVHQVCLCWCGADPVAVFFLRMISCPLYGCFFFVETCIFKERHDKRVLRTKEVDKEGVVIWC